MTSTVQTSTPSIDSSSSSTIYYPPPAPPPGTAANPIDLLPRRSTAAAVSFVGTSSTGQRHPGSFNFVENHSLPPPGPEHYHARREIWRTAPIKASTEHPPTEESATPTPTEKISAMIASASSIASEDLWNRGLRTLSQGLLEGHRLRKPLGMDVVIKILHATWLRDGTWPSATINPPFSDDEMPVVTPQTSNGKGKEKGAMSRHMEVDPSKKPGAMLQDDIADGEEEDLASEGELQERDDDGAGGGMRVVER